MTTAYATSVETARYHLMNNRDAYAIIADSMNFGDPKRDRADFAVIAWEVLEYIENYSPDGWNMFPSWANIGRATIIDALVQISDSWE